MTAGKYTPEMAADLRMPHEPRLSPDGNSLAFRVEPIGHHSKDRTSTIFVTSADGSGIPAPVTSSDAYNTAAVWSPDSRSLAFLSDRHQQGTAQLYVIPATGGEALRLTDLKGGVSNPSWNTDGKSLLFTARRTALTGATDTESEINVASERWRPQAVARVPATGGPPILIGPSAGHVWTYALSASGREVAAVVSDNEDLAGLWNNVRLVVFGVAGDGERELLRLTGFPSRPVWSSDGHYVAMIGSQLPDADSTNVRIVDVASGDITVLDDRGMTPTWAAFRDDRLIVHSVDTQRSRLDITDIRGSEWEILPLHIATDSVWIESGLNIDCNDTSLALTLSRPEGPPDIHIATADGTVIRCTSLNPQLDDVPLASMQQFDWESADGLQIHGWLMLPNGGSYEQPLPLVTAIHGGPSWQWGNWFHGTWHDWGQLLASNGYAVFLPNPRGSTGRGGTFTGSNRFDFGGDDFSDIMSGIDTLIDQGVADSDRLGICGWSYGGFMTAWAVTQTTRFKAAVAGAAPTNWVSKIGTTDIRPFNEWSLGEVNCEPDRVWDRSPIRYVSNVSTPTLIVHGEADPRVPVTQGAELYNALKALGVDTEMVSYPRQGHAFHERSFQIDLMQRLVGWFDRYIEPSTSSAESPGESRATN